MTTTINYAGHDVPVLGSYDVAIVGGGSSGAACAIRCAQLGLSVIIIDRFTMLGGTATNATVCPMMPTYVAHRQVFAQVEEGLKASGDVTRDGTTTMVWFAPERLGRVYEDLVTRSGGSILYDATLVDVVDDGAQDGARTLQSLIAMTAQGLVAIDARTMVDASGDAVLARAAGVSTESGDETGANQVCSLRFIMGGIDVDTYRDYCLSLGDNFSPLKTGFFWESAMVAGRDFVLESIFREGVADGLLEEGDLRYYQTFPGSRERWHSTARTSPVWSRIPQRRGARRRLSKRTRPLIGSLDSFRQKCLGLSIRISWESHPCLAFVNRGELMGSTGSLKKIM